MNPSLSDREAVLMRNFIEKMALWADVTDPKRHFEIEVPRRALYQPVLRYAIFAFSSRHLNRGPRGDETEALHYHSQCLQLLIAALDASEEDEGSDEILASAAILRQFEEMDAEDFQFHLSGTTRMLNSTPEFGFSGGLREATAWLCLRQDIYISLVSQQPLRTNLEKFSHSRVFEDDDDFAWANRIVYLLAKALSCAFRGGPSVTTIKILCQLDNEVEDWRMSRPNTFDPIRFVPRSREKERRIPEIWMLSPVHVVGLQYYHIAKILLAVSTQPTLSNAYESLRRGRSIERCVCHHLLVVLGLAQSNAKAENALFTARHCLSAWGGVLRHRLDQAAAEDLLITVERITGWSTARLIQSLRGQWDEYSDED
ncbi:hypothetical protein BGW36DRAFT_308944 [Talaromyces proteolyticus]|uniref:Transcription factor domain-containing protein n=1 Tax=Talaromyces proteolyticus TaxID=1131652 RepID=A0AAD4KDE4_9EURO|nr:uncharacterized protein BGW36DRAFT_308944 [Talaromyces proteolyticus]KAH8689047.1 hypothetical protein BGW36DRAFT_308944 [Talaromyces proteolyticus]